jgi:hypothetical protein
LDERNSKPSAPADEAAPARPVNRFGGPDPSTFASSSLWDPVIPSAEVPNEWAPSPSRSPSAPPVPVHEPSPLFRADKPDPAGVADSGDQSTEADLDEEPDPRAEQDEPEGPGEFGWPEFDRTPRADGGSRESGGRSAGSAVRSAGGDAGSDRPPRPDRREGHERSHEPA